MDSGRKEAVPHCAAQWPNLGPAGGAWTCTLDKGHDGDHEARGPGGRPLNSPSSIIPQGDDEILYPIPCPGGCGCRLGTDDADRLECGCDGGVLW